MTTLQTGLIGLKNYGFGSIDESEDATGISAEEVAQNTVYIESVFHKNKEIFKGLASKSDNTLNSKSSNTKLDNNSNSIFSNQNNEQSYSQMFDKSLQNPTGTIMNMPKATLASANVATANSNSTKKMFIA